MIVDFDTFCVTDNIDATLDAIESKIKIGELVPYQPNWITLQ